jgi:hypothetical protein
VRVGVYIGGEQRGSQHTKRRSKDEQGEEAEAVLDWSIFDRSHTQRKREAHCLPFSVYIFSSSSL